VAIVACDEGQNGLDLLLEIEKRPLGSRLKPLPSLCPRAGQSGHPDPQADRRRLVFAIRVGRMKDVRPGMRGDFIDRGLVEPSVGNLRLRERW
jgi:hypothetical protein